MVLFSRSVLAVTLLVFLALCNVGMAQNDPDFDNLDARQDGGGGGDDDGDGDFDPVTIAECTECVHQQNLPDDQVEDAIAACMIKAASDPDFDCGDDNSQGGERELDSYLDNRGWKPFKKVKSWFRKNKERIRRALLKARCIARCYRISNIFSRRRCIAACVRRYRG